MAAGCLSGTFSGSSGALQNSGSEEDVQKLMDQRKRKRMISNRESARRSRMRKQNHLDELMNQVDDLRKENNQIISAMNLTTQHYLNVEADNSVLRAQLSELSHRLQSLNQIIHFLNTNNGHGGGDGGFSSNLEEEPFSSFGYAVGDPFLYDPLFNNLYANQLPLMASADLLQY